MLQATGTAAKINRGPILDSLRYLHPMAFYPDAWSVQPGQIGTALVMAWCHASYPSEFHSGCSRRDDGACPTPNDCRKSPSPRCAPLFSGPPVRWAKASCRNAVIDHIRCGMATTLGAGAEDGRANDIFCLMSSSTACSAAMFWVTPILCEIS
jgi:hypothetical protein